MNKRNLLFFYGTDSDFDFSKPCQSLGNSKGIWIFLEKKITKLNDTYLHKVHKIGKFIEIESRVVVTQGRGEGNGKLFLNGLFDSISVWGDEKFLVMDGGNGYKRLYT